MDKNLPQFGTCTPHAPPIKIALNCGLANQGDFSQQALTRRRKAFQKNDLGAMVELMDSKQVGWDQILGRFNGEMI